MDLHTPEIKKEQFSLDFQFLLAAEMNGKGMSFMWAITINVPSYDINTDLIRDAKCNALKHANT